MKDWTEKHIRGLLHEGKIQGFKDNNKMIEPMAKPGLHLTVRCINCGTPFRQSRSDQQCCSQRCGYRIWYRRNHIKTQEKACEWCGNLFKPVTETQKHCSKKCTYEKRKKTLSNGRGKYWAKGVEYVPRSICVVCGNKFYCPPVVKARSENSGTFCSYKCRGLASSEINKIKYADKRIEKAKSEVKERIKKEVIIKERRERIMKLLKPCKYCGKETTKEYCNQKCYVLYKKSMIGANLIKKLCLNCRKEITVTPGQHNAGFGKYCSWSCASVQRVKNRTVPMCGNARGGKRADLNDKYFRSRWEANYARYLNVLIQQGSVIKWEYEVQTFYFDNIKRGSRSYTPDFKVYYCKGDVKFIEIKGYMDQRSKTKLSRMKKYYPQITVEVIDSKKYLPLHRTLKHIIPNWECDNSKKAGYSKAR